MSMNVNDFKTIFCILAGLLFCLNSCEQKKQEKASGRAPELIKKELSLENHPILPEIIQIKEEVKRGNAAYDTVRKYLFALPDGISSRDAEALLDILMEPPAAHWSSLGWGAIFNDGMNVLRQMKNAPPGFARRLMECHADETRPEVIRNYALQHFGSLLVTYYRDPEGKGKRVFPKSSERMEVEKELMAALRPKNGAMMGTACNLADDILNACALSGAQSPIKMEELGACCRDIALSGEESEHARITAFGFLARHVIPDAAEGARGIMDDSSQSVLLRAAAIHYVGKLGREQDQASLEKLARNSDVRLSVPARTILKEREQK